MNNKTLNKRKSLVTTNLIPGKIRKIDNISASPKQVIKNKSAYKNQTSQKPGEKFVLLKENRNPSKDERELTDDESSFSEEENGTNDSVEEINGNNDLADSNNEESEIEEADSGSDVEEEGNSDEEVENNGEDTSDGETEGNEEANSNNEESDNEEAETDGDLEVEEEGDSDEEVENNEEANSDSNNEESDKEEAESGGDLEEEEEANSDNELEIDEEANSNEGLVNGEEVNSDDEKANSDDEEVNSDNEEANSDDEEANTDDEPKEEVEASDDSDNEAQVYDDSDEDAEDNAKEIDKNYENNKNEITYNKTKVENFSVIVNGIKKAEDLQQLFQGCKIMYYDLSRRFTDELTGRAFVYFEDEKSYKNAFKKNGTIFNGTMIDLERLLKCSSKLTAYVSGLSPIANIEKIFHDCEIESYRRFSNNQSAAFVNFKDETSMAKALGKNETIVNNCVLRVKQYHDKVAEIETRLEVRVEGLSPITNVDILFDDCKIASINLQKTISRTKTAYIAFADEESLEKALLKDETKHDGCLIRVLRTDCTVKVEGLNPKSKPDEVFKDCKINSYKILKTNCGHNQGITFIDFKDVESLKTALMKNRTECDGRMILVHYKKYITPNKHNDVEQAPSKKSFPHKKQFNQAPFKKSFAPRKQGTEQAFKNSFQPRKQGAEQAFKKSFVPRKQDAEQRFNKSFPPRKQGAEQPFKKSFTPRKQGAEQPFKKSFKPRKQGVEQASFKKSFKPEPQGFSNTELSDLKQKELLLKLIKSQVLPLQKEIFSLKKKIKKNTNEKTFNHK